VRARLQELPAEPVLKRPSINPTEANLDNVCQLVRSDFLNPKLLQLGHAIPNPQLLPIEKLNRMLSRETRCYAFQSVSYDLPSGNLRLRQQIAQRRLSGGILIPDQLVNTFGCFEAVVLALQLLCEPGDAIAIETPVYFTKFQPEKSLPGCILEEIDQSAGNCLTNVMVFSIAVRPHFTFNISILIAPKFTLLGWK